MISCVIFAAFAQCFFMAYYATVPGYQSIQGSLMSVLRFTVLDFDYAALSQVPPLNPDQQPGRRRLSVCAAVCHALQQSCVA